MNSLHFADHVVNFGACGVFASVSSGQVRLACSYLYIIKQEH